MRSSHETLGVESEASLGWASVREKAEEKGSARKEKNQHSGIA